MCTFRRRKLAHKNNGKTVWRYEIRNVFGVLIVAPDYVDKIALTAGGGKAAHPADICNPKRVLFLPKLCFFICSLWFGLPTRNVNMENYVCVWDFSIYWHFGIIWLHHIIITFNLMFFVGKLFFFYVYLFFFSYHN